MSFLPYLKSALVVLRCYIFKLVYIYRAQQHQFLIRNLPYQIPLDGEKVGEMFRLSQPSNNISGTKIKWLASSVYSVNLVTLIYLYLFYLFSSLLFLLFIIEYGESDISLTIRNSFNIGTTGRSLFSGPYNLKSLYSEKIWISSKSLNKIQFLHYFQGCSCV